MNNIGVYGLGVMGQSLARNIMQHGFSVSVYNIETEITKQFTQKYPKLFGYESLEAFVNSLEKPRKIILMVTAGRVVDLSLIHISKYTSLRTESPVRHWIDRIRI